MANIVDYLAWRGDISLEVSPWNELDGLLMAVLSYLNFHGVQDHRGWTLEEAKRIDLLIGDGGASFEGRKKVFEAMADSARFSGCRMHHFIARTDEELSMQFSAECLDLPDGTMCVAFRGTDNTLVGWREDFNMAYQTQVPAQAAAAYEGNRREDPPGGPQQGRKPGGVCRLQGNQKGPGPDREHLELRRAGHEHGNGAEQRIRADPVKDPFLNPADEHHRPADGIL